MEEYVNMTLLKKFARWLWLKATDEDPIVVAGHFDTLSALNGCHVRFIEQLEKDHPELKSLIEEHQKDRARACEPVYHCDICKVPMRENKLYTLFDGLEVCERCKNTPRRNWVTNRK